MLILKKHLPAILGHHFKKPTGFLGRFVSNIMVKGNTIAHERVLDVLKIQKGNEILEIGYGPGVAIYEILSNNDCRCTGIDFSELMYKKALKRNRKFVHDNKLILNHGDFLSFDVPENHFDIVFCINVVYFWDDLKIPFSKIFSILKEGGRFCFHMAHRDELNKLNFTKDHIFNKYTIAEVTDSLKAAGFAKVDYWLDKAYLVTCTK